MKKVIKFQSLFISVFITLVTAAPVFAQTTGSITQVESFISSVIQTMVTIAGFVAAGFFVWGGFGYITSSGNPENLDRSKKTILYSAVGLAISIGALVISGIVSSLANTAFGTAAPTH